MDSTKKAKKKLVIRRKKPLQATSSSSAVSESTPISVTSSSSSIIRRKKKLIVRKKKVKTTTSETTTQSSDLTSFLSTFTKPVSHSVEIDEGIASAAATPVSKLDNYSINIIVPFRDNLVLKHEINQDRAVHLARFKGYMLGTFLPEVKQRFLKNGISADITISIIEQSQDGQRFNRGALLNTGFLINPNFDVYIFHDVDLIPNERMLNIYSTKYSRDSIVHFAGGWDRYSGDDYIGGVTLMGNNIFQAINGFPNDYWGWGGEDDEIKRRLATLGLYKNLQKIRIRNGFTDLENIDTALQKRQLLKTNVKELDNVIKQEQAQEHKITWNVNGINQSIISFYEIIDSNIEEFQGINYQLFQVHFDYDKIKPNIDERVVRRDLYQGLPATTGHSDESKMPEEDEETLFGREDEIIRTKTGIADGTAGYGDTELSEEGYLLATAPEKYRHKFEYYFSSFPQALKEKLIMDEAMTFSVTEANMANLISQKILELPEITRDSSIIDATAGAGGNSMSFMAHFNSVDSIELNSNRCGMLKHNLDAFKETFGQKVTSSYNVHCGSYNAFLKPADVIFFDPPWGGIDYLKKDRVQLQLGGIFMYSVANSVKSFTKYVVMKLPLNYNIDSLSTGVSSQGGTLSYQIINDIITDKPKMLLVFINYDKSDLIIDSNLSVDRINELFELSRYPMSFNTLDECKANEDRLPTITNPIVFYKLLESIDINAFTKKVDETQDLREDVFSGKFNKTDIRNTFDYLFYKIKLGVFIMIKDNKLKYFIPFQNQHFVNDWSSLISFSDDISNIEEYAASRKEYIRDALNMNITTWDANNCVLGTWLGNDIGDMGWSEFRELLTELCENRQINDCIFFYNRRDNPVLSKTRSEPYNHLFNSYSHPLESYRFDTYIPIVGYCNNEHFADQLIPTYADWRDITKKYYPSSCQNMNVSDINLNWSTKHPIAVFRGSATGCGVTPETNDRIGISLISKALKAQGKNNLLDAGLTGFNLRDKKMSGGPVSFFKYKDYGLEKSDRIPMNEQSNFKYIVHIDGHVSAYRLGKELSLGSTIIKVKSRGNYKVWFSNRMIKLEKDLSNIDIANYIEVKMDNPSKLLGIINYLNHNDKVAKKLAENALRLYNEIITRDYMFNYMENLINKVSTNYYLDN